MTDIIWNFFSFIVALGILVTVHEFGHFWVARRCGVMVEKFSIGFGKSLWRWKGKDGVEYSISMIPLGGFVKMLDSRVDEVPEAQKNRAFNHKKLWQRTAIVAAGPVFNFLFAIFAYWLMLLIGVMTIKPIIGEVQPNSIFANAGIEAGMELKEISGIQTNSWDTASMALVSRIGDDSITITAAYPEDLGSERRFVLDTREWQFDPEKDLLTHSLGFSPYRPDLLLTLSHIEPGTPAERAGLQVGDRILSINDGERLAPTDWNAVSEEIRANPNQSIKLEIERNGTIQSLYLMPEVRQLNNGQEVGYAGFSPRLDEWPQGYRWIQKFGMIEAIPKAIEKTNQLIGLTLTMLKKLFTGDVGLDNLSGPISIAKGAGTTADNGLVYFLGFLALISVNLGIINLLPLPVLDGGHLLFFAVEAVIRRPVPEKIQEIGYKLGTFVIFSLMLIAIFNDFTRL